MRYRAASQAADETGFGSALVDADVVALTGGTRAARNGATKVDGI
jgi:hypothetical protein